MNPPLDTSKITKPIRTVVKSAIVGVILIFGLLYSFMGSDIFSSGFFFAFLPVIIFFIVAALFMIFAIKKGLNNPLFVDPASRFPFKRKLLFKKSEQAKYLIIVALFLIFVVFMERDSPLVSENILVIVGLLLALVVRGISDYVILSKREKDHSPKEL